MLLATNLQYVFHLDEIYLQVCPVRCLKSDWNHEIMHNRGSFSVELLSLPIWPRSCFRSSVVQAVFPVEALPSPREAAAGRVGCSCWSWLCYRGHGWRESVSPNRSGKWKCRKYRQSARKSVHFIFCSL